MGEEREYPGIDALTSTAALSGASREEADALLRKQRELIGLQIEDLKREDTVRHWSLRVRHVSDVMKLAFELSLAFIFIVLAVGLVAVLWSASHDDGLVIESFSVPPDMAARGLDGRAVASQLLDKLSHMQNQTGSMRPARSYANDWGSDIKVQIPETGVSAGEMYRFLVQWLGHETRVTGEVFRTANGITLTARVDGSDGASLSGAEGDLETLEQKAAEQIYAQTQPYRYAVFETDLKHYAEAKRLFLALADNDSSTERAWALTGLGSLEESTPSGDEHVALDDYRKAAENDPDLTLTWNDIENTEGALGFDELRLSAIAQILDLNAQGKFVNANCAAINNFRLRGNRDALLGDYQSAAAEYAQGERLPGCRGNADLAFLYRMDAMALGHRAAVAEAEIGALPPGRNFDALKAFATEQELGVARMSVALGLREWKLVAAEVPREGGDTIDAMRNLTAVRPLLALAHAEAGDAATADALIAPTPRDCYLCVRVRGRIAAIERKWDASARWFEAATKLAPSLPTAFSEWGEMLLAGGDLDGATAKFEIANQKGPHFADPLELWGEALMAKNRSDLALAKFSEANQYAPQWGRLHLKWGEALRYAGQPDEANRQFAIAAGLFLTGPEHAALERDRGTHG
jgi:tetratricopeptide (TPR) repeat protein